MEEISCEEAKKIISDIVEHGGVIFSDHAQDQMGLRGYSTRDVLYILKYGSVKKITKERNERYNCQVHGKDIDGDDGTIITIMIRRIKLVVVTVLGGV
jgi:hypothetical protein